MPPLTEVTLMAAEQKGFVVYAGGRPGEYRAVLCAGSFDECLDWIRAQAFRRGDPPVPTSYGDGA